MIEIVRQLLVAGGLEAAIETLARNMFGVFSCRRFVMAARQRQEEEILVWTASNRRGDASPRIARGSLERPATEALLAPAAACWYACRGSGDFEIHCSRPPGDPLKPAWSRSAAGALDVLGPRESCVAVAFECGAELSCRLFVIDPGVNRPRRNVIRLTRDLAAVLAPVLHNVYVTERARTHAADAERAHLARTLHDGVIQSLIAAEMDIHRAWQRSIDGSIVSTTELRRIQQILHGEVLGLRELMQRVKPVQIQPGDLCDALSACIGRFRTDTGLACSFSAHIAQLSLPPASCALVVRIVSEALSNIRKHSGARHVRVAIREAHAHWRLVIEDDGRGFDGVPPAPAVIRECVRSLDGEMRVLRAPGRGLRLEIAFAGDAAACERLPASIGAPLHRDRPRGQVVPRPAGPVDSPRSAAETAGPLR